MSVALLIAQSSLTAALGLGGAWLLRHRSPLDRAIWLKLALALLLCAPLLPRVRLPMPQALAALAPRPQAVVQAPVPSVAGRTAVATTSTQPRAAAFNPALMLLAAYGLGVAALLGHLALGLALLRRWSRKGQRLDDPQWLAALAASGAPRGTRLLVSDRIKAPLSWGLRHPVILIDPASALRAADAPAILAHEAAHIAGFDWPALMAARLATAVFWFNPLVWLLSRALVQQCEEAADAHALERCEATGYAQTLLTCLSGMGPGRLGHGAVPANGMAAGHGLTRRVHQVLRAAPADLLRRSRGVLAGMTVVSGLAMAASLVSFASAQEAPRPLHQRIVHPDGTVETRRRAADGQMTIRKVSADGRRISITRYGPDDAVPALPPVPPVPPMRSLPRMPSAAPVAPQAPQPPAPPAPPAPPLPPLADADDDLVPGFSSQQIAHIRDAALRLASQALAQSQVQSVAQSHAMRIQALAIASQARDEARDEVRVQLAQSAQIRTQALDLARRAVEEARTQARTQSRAARAEAQAARDEARAARDEAQD